MMMINAKVYFQKEFVMSQSPILPNVSRSTIVQAAAIYLLIAAFFNLCGGILGLMGGAFAGFAGAVSVGTAPLDGTGELAQAGAELAAAGGMLLFIGIVGIIMAPVMLAAAVGLFQRRRWARMLTVAIAAVSAVVSLLSLLFGFSLFDILWIALGAFVAYFFYTDPGIQMELVN